MPVMEQPAADELPPFATPEEVQAFTKGKLKASEPRVERALQAVSASMREEAGWHIWPILRGHSVVLDGQGGTLHPLPSLRVLELSAVDNAGEAVDPETVDVSRSGLMERTDRKQWTRRLGKLRVTMDHGYGDVPDLAALCMALVARGLASPLGANQESAGSLSVSWGGSSAGGSLQPYNSEAGTLAKYTLGEV